MKIIIRKRAINAMIKAAAFVEGINTPGSGDRWLEKVKLKISGLAKAKAKYALCNHPSLSKFQFSCYTHQDWIIAFKITGDKMEVCRFIYGPRLH